MKIDEMKRRKKELGYTNAMVAELSGVPLGTVQKIFCGATRHPRIDTLEAIEMVLKDRYPASVNDTAAEYAAISDLNEEVAKPEGQKVDYWTAKAEPSERWPRQGYYTLEDYYAIPDDVRVELIDGVIYDLATPTLNHQRIQLFLANELLKCISDHDKACEVIIAPFDVRLDRDDRTMIEPDVMIVCDLDTDGNANHLEGEPDLAVEILSPSTRGKDCTVKLRKYMNAGVREYWIIDPESRRVLVYSFADDILPTQYSFDDVIPVSISDGACSIDFSKINEKLMK